MKNTIKLTESQLKKIISESVKNTLNEISSDMLMRAYKKANDKRIETLNTPEYGKRHKQMKNFNQNYSQKFGKENNFSTGEGASVGNLRVFDTDANGNQIEYSFQPGCMFVNKRGPYEIADLLISRSSQQQICRMSPKVAQTVAKWFQQNSSEHERASWRRSELNLEPTFNPEFWSQYYSK